MHPRPKYAKNFFGAPGLCGAVGGKHKIPVDTLYINMTNFAAVCIAAGNTRYTL